MLADTARCYNSYTKNYDKDQSITQKIHHATI